MPKRRMKKRDTNCISFEPSSVILNLKVVSNSPYAINLFILRKVSNKYLVLIFYLRDFILAYKINVYSVIYCT
jgi:hypothetical protein